MKKYKSGQFISIGGKLARASMANTRVVCAVCKRENGYDTPYCNHASECSKKLNFNLYPKFIKR